ncbi:MAG TPA: hypothetical protein VNV62_13805 [Trebonia sp.]|jgi:hypothetical protein|nr:hypothetical protein [Trebonia sp.]
MIVEVPRRLPRRGQAIAAFAVLALLIQLLLAQLTLVFAVLFVMIGRVSRWRRSWLLAPAAVGLFWGLAAGPGHVIAGFAAGPAQVLSYFGHGHALARLGHPSAGFARPGDWLPRQLPVALIAAAAQAAAIGWLGRPRAGQPALPPRPGALAALRGARAARMIRTGAVLTRNGCALGVARDTGAVAELRWAEIAGGAVVIGSVATEVTVTCLQVVHAALRRRKPLIIIDPGNDAAIARAVSAACAATGTPLRLSGGAPADSADAGSPDADIDLIRVVSERSAALLPARSPRLAEQACASLAALAAELRRIGVDGDALVWVSVAESLPAQAFATLIRDGAPAGLAVLIGAASPATSTELAGSAAAVLTLAPKPRSRKPWQFSLVVAAPRRRQLGLADMIPARLPPAYPGRPPEVMSETLAHRTPARPPPAGSSQRRSREVPARLPDDEMPAWLPDEVPTGLPGGTAMPGGRS